MTKLLVSIGIALIFFIGAKKKTAPEGLFQQDLDIDSLKKSCRSGDYKACYILEDFTKRQCSRINPSDLKAKEACQMEALDWFLKGLYTENGAIKSRCLGGTKAACDSMAQLLNQKLTEKITLPNPSFQLGVSRIVRCWENLGIAMDQLASTEKTKGKESQKYSEVLNRVNWILKSDDTCRQLLRGF